MADKPEIRRYSTRTLERIMRDVLAGVRNFTARNATASPVADRAVAGSGGDSAVDESGARVIPFRRRNNGDPLP